MLQKAKNHGVRVIFVLNRYFCKSNRKKMMENYTQQADYKKSANGSGRFWPPPRNSVMVFTFGKILLLTFLISSLPRFTNGNTIAQTRATELINQVTFNSDDSYTTVKRTTENLFRVKKDSEDTIKLLYHEKEYKYSIVHAVRKEQGILQKFHIYELT
jgi:hypothetical protein